MSCKKLEQSIFLYDELLPGEKANVDNHLRDCKDCLALFQQIQQQHAILNSMQSRSAEIKNPARLADTIMRAINAKTHSPERKNIADYFDNLVGRYALGAISMTLVIILFIDTQWYARSSDTQSQSYRQESQSQVILNTTTFLKSLQRPKAETGVITSLYSCIGSSRCDYIIKSFKQKKNNAYENI